ncbi:DNA invertase Pin-like site-specific DNA recombinase [Microbacterium sp. AG157]|uniref:recombinase family protein n=1 Tax=Microbacterium sp. AG157 TaxID=2183993 RepID=UPI000E3AE6AE|nr:recombinase family protein [Microbacterium sp. AG157]REC96786.1 DNA invertase Pin-like site-specific DNA recombinase [Microbacterium sp. AG157]
MTDPKPLRAVLYVRLSKESARSTSITGQTDDLSVIAERAGWDVVATFTDNGKSGGKERENAQAAYDLWARGDADILAVYAYDRWSRMGIKTLAALIEVVDARAKTPHPATFIAAREGIESTQPDWQLRAAFAADMAKRERDLVSSRQTAARDRMRRQGRNAGHGVPPFGYRTGPHPTLPVGRGLHVIPEEADVVRELAERLIAGESTVKLADELTKRGVATAHSEARRAALAGLPVDGLDRGRWKAGRLGKTWTSDHLLGRISNNGAPLLDESGEPLAPFEPILTLETVLAIRDRFTPDKQGQLYRRASGLLSRMAFCSGCDRPLYPRRTSVSERNPDGYINYGCSAQAAGVSCAAKVTISARKLEAEVVSRYLAARGELPETRVVSYLSGGAPAGELSALEARLKELAGRLAAADDEEELEALTSAMATLRARRKSLRGQLAIPAERVEATGRTWAEAWNESPERETRRRMLLHLIDHVVVHPVSASKRVVIYWQPERQPPE